jgi:hypothetical protein
VNVADPDVGFNPRTFKREERQDWTVLQVGPVNDALVSADRARDFHSSSTSIRFNIHHTYDTAKSIPQYSQHMMSTDGLSLW